MEDLDALVRRVDPDRWLATRFITDAQARADVVALYAFDHELARAPKVVSNAIMGEIRLTWWSDALDEIYQGRPVRRHPVTLALAQAIRRHDLPRAPLEAMIEGRYPELDGEPPAAAAVAAATMTLAARILGQADAPVAATAAAWGQGAAAGLAAANAELRGLKAAAFPAVAYVTLLRAPKASALMRRVRLAWAVLRGRV